MNKLPPIRVLDYNAVWVGQGFTGKMVSHLSRSVLLNPLSTKATGDALKDLARPRWLLEEEVDVDVEANCVHREGRDLISLL